jgi:hypothetical protein
MARWRKDYDPHQLAQRIEKTRTTSASGGVSYSGFAHLEHVVLLGSMLQLNDQIPDIEKRRILNKAILDAGAKGVVTPESLLRHASKLESEYFQEPIDNFILLTGISIGHGIKMPTFRINGATVSINPKLSKTISRHRAELLDSARHSIAGDLPTNYAHVSVGVKARSPYGAFQSALDSLDLLRGIWNFRKNSRFRISSGKRQPVNSILLAPIHTLHKHDGSPACELWWYEPSYVEPIRPFADQTRIDNMVKYTANFRKYLSRSNYESDLIAATLRYVRALDSRDWNDAFIRLWSVLESLTATKEASYAVTIRRAAFMFAERDYSFQVLSCLMDYRNRSVHAGAESDEIESLLYLLKRYVEALLAFHVRGRFNFTSMTNASEFMGLPWNKETLDKEIAKLKLAKKFITKT